MGRLPKHWREGLQATRLDWIVLAALATGFAVVLAASARAGHSGLAAQIVGHFHEAGWF